MCLNSEIWHPTVNPDSTHRPTIELPWGAWYEEGVQRLDLPPGWSCDILHPRGAPPVDADEIARALDSPVACSRLEELAAGCRTACVIVDDLARPTRAADLLPPVLECLHTAGVPPDGVRIVIATGSHAPLSAEQWTRKVGSRIASSYHIESHDCHGAVAKTGIAYGDGELEINRTFYEADLKIGIGSVLPHSFAGYSGGAKLVLPGLANLAATARSHKFVQLGLRGGADPNENRFRHEAEKLARQLGLGFIVCAVPGCHGETAAVVAGDVVAAHRQACEAARRAFYTKLDARRTPYDCLLLNAYPKDVDLIQAENAFVALKGVRSPIVREDGVVILASATSEGLGRHGLFEPGGVSYTTPKPKRALGNRELWLYTPNLSNADVHRLYWSGYPVFQEADRLVWALAERFSRKRGSVASTAETHNAVVEATVDEGAANYRDASQRSRGRQHRPRGLQTAAPTSLRMAVLPCAPMQQLWG
jgi:lactate racemase